MKSLVRWIYHLVVTSDVLPMLLLCEERASRGLPPFSVDVWAWNVPRPFGQKAHEQCHL